MVKWFRGKINSNQLFQTKSTLNGSRNPDGRGVLNLKLGTLLGVMFIAVSSLQSRSFEKTALCF